MFGTMIICLPSPHEGERIQLTHNKTAKFLSTQHYQPSCAAWYSDVRHEIEEVTSGYRLVLTYNLAKGSGELVPISKSLENSDEYLHLFKALQDWKRSDSFRSTDAENTNELIYMLEHQYTGASLELGNLKNLDLARAKAIAHFADRLGFTMSLARISLDVCGTSVESRRSSQYSSEHDSDEDSESEKKFHSIDLEE